MRIIVLGSAAGGGSPQWNCNCATCRRVREGAPGTRVRTQSSLAVSGDGVRWVLLNASPDIRQQILATPRLHPREGVRHSPIAAVVLTNADVDHVAGLLTLRERQPFALHASDRVHAALDANPIFRVVDPEVAPRRPLPLGVPVKLAAADGAPLGLTVEAFAVPGKVALYLEDQKAGADFGTREGDTIGLFLREPASGACAYYIPGCAAVDEALARRLTAAPLVLFDGTLFTDDEMVAAGLGVKTGRRMGHISVSGPDGSLAAFAPLRVRRRIFVHINNTNPILIDGTPERRAVEDAGWEVAHDGMEIEVQPA